MSLTQNYKTVTLSEDALQFAVIAVLTQLRADRREVARLPAPAFDDFLVKEVALGTEALAALNAAVAA